MVVESVAPYSGKLFHRKAIEWIAATDQVSDILTRSKVVITLAFSLSKHLNIKVFRSLLESRLGQNMGLTFQVGNQPAVRS